MTSFAEIDLPHNAFYAQKVRTPSPPTPQSPRPRAQPDHADSQACLHLFVTISICANLMCTASTTFVSVWGSGKALRGKVCAQRTRRLAHTAHSPASLPCLPIPSLPTSRPSPQDGSMFEAVDGMNDERAFIFTCFGAPLHANPHVPHVRGNRKQPGGPGLTPTLTQRQVWDSSRRCSHSCLPHGS